MTILKTRKLTKSFGGVRAVDHVDLSFEGGKVTALVGPNGSGKTTLINTITGIVPVDGGEIVIGSESFRCIRSSDIATYGITRTFQNSRLIQQMSVLDNLLLVLTKRNVFGALFERHEAHHLDKAEAALRRVGLWEKRNEQTENLSYGQRKLLEIARATLMRADIYFFDEPFAGLFPEMVKIVSMTLGELRAGGAAIVLVEHDMALVRELADHCYVLDSGKVIAEGTPEHVLKQENVVEAYLGK
jgi:ABC-type branched-subunit amino acid transport system ATPase component